jgi:hypothetical protein
MRRLLAVSIVVLFSHVIHDVNTLQCSIHSTDDLLYRHTTDQNMRSSQVQVHLTSVRNKSQVSWILSIGPDSEHV